MIKLREFVEKNEPTMVLILMLYPFILGLACLIESEILFIILSLGLLIYMTLWGLAVAPMIREDKEND